MALRKIVAGVLALAMALISAGTAMSQENGSFQSVGTYQYHYVTIAHAGQTYRGGPIEGARTITRSSGGPFVVGEITVSACLVFSGRSEDGIHLEAPCMDADKAGHVFYTYAIRQEGDLAVGGGGPGRWELRGGTGTYEGITGSCSYQTDYLDDTFLTVVADCTCSRGEYVRVEVVDEADVPRPKAQDTQTAYRPPSAQPSFSDHASEILNRAANGNQIGIDIVRASENLCPDQVPTPEALASAAISKNIRLTGAWAADP